MSNVRCSRAAYALTLLFLTACSSSPGDRVGAAAPVTPSAGAASTSAPASSDSAATPAASTVASTPLPGASTPYATAETAPFKALATDTIAALDAGNKDVMIAKLTDLETLWDDKESALSPKDPATWDTIDKALDRGISALRSSRTDLPKGRIALQDFVAAIDRATKS